MVHSGRPVLLHVACSSFVYSFEHLGIQRDGDGTDTARQDRAIFV